MNFDEPKLTNPSNEENEENKANEENEENEIIRLRRLDDDGFSEVSVEVENEFEVDLGPKVSAQFAHPPRLYALKRETSHSESIDRNIKRVKFSSCSKILDGKKTGGRKRKLPQEQFIAGSNEICNYEKCSKKGILKNPSTKHYAVATRVNKERITEADKLGSEELSDLSLESFKMKNLNENPDKHQFNRHKTVTERNQVIEKIMPVTRNAESESQKESCVSDSVDLNYGGEKTPYDLTNQKPKRKFKMSRKRNAIVPEPSKLLPNIISRKDRKHLKLGNNESFTVASANEEAENVSVPTCSLSNSQNTPKDSSAQLKEIEEKEETIILEETKIVEASTEIINVLDLKTLSKAKSVRRCSKDINSLTSTTYKVLNSGPKRSSCISYRQGLANKQVDENKTLKETKKYYEDKLKEMGIKEKEFSNENRILREKYEMEISKVVKDSKKEAAKLLAELRSKERIVDNLQKSLYVKNSGVKDLKKEQTVTNKESSSQSFSGPRSSLARSVSAAASIGRRIRHPNSKEKKSIKEETKKQKDDLLRQGNDGTTNAEEGPKREKVRTPAADKASYKIEQLKKTIENQEEEIILLQEKLKLQNTNLQSFNQLSASVPSVYEHPSNFEVYFAPNGQNDSPSMLPSNPPFCSTPNEAFIRQKEFENCDTMSTLEEQSRSLDFLEARFNSIGPSAMSLGYSSLASTHVVSREQELTEENDMLRAELQEAKDHSELLEFRILEFTEGIQKATGGVHPTRDQSTCTTTDDVIISISSSSLLSDDLSLPLSLDSGLELNLDCNSKSRLIEYRKSLAKLEESSSYIESASVAHLSLLLDWAESVSSIYHETLPPIMSPRSPLQKKMDSSSDIGDMGLDSSTLGTDLNLLAAKLQESLGCPNDQEEVLQETIIKLRSVNSSLNRLQSRVSSLTTENKDLQEALATLHEAHETRTEASGTESELVHGKTPSLHSDLSDAESDETPSSSKRTNIETSTSFQESGIFESSCDLVTSATQTLQESDEYLVADLEGETVILSKLEYDALVATERALQREIEILQYEKDQLSEQCLNLDEQLQELSKSCHSDATQVLRAELRLLDERLEVSDRLKRQFFDEKCEIEEAENDARLLAQRLESQLEAAREMESLLSASLSQEQEFCRELQRRVREMHAIDKSRRMHEEVLAKESQSFKRREAALIKATDNQQSQLLFGLYGLILIQFWRRLASFNRLAVVPYNPQNVSDIEDKYLKQFCSTWLSGYSPETSCYSPSVDTCLKCSYNLSNQTTLINLLDGSTQTLSKESRDEAVQTTTANGDNVETQCTVCKLKDDCEEIASEPVHKKQRVSEMSSHLSSENDGLSEREQYYLTQIEALQKERKYLRENFASSQSGSLNQLQASEVELDEVKQKLEDAQRDKRKLLGKLEESQTAIIEAEAEFQRQIKELKIDFNRSVESYLIEQQNLQQKYEAKLAEMRKISEVHEHRFTALLQQYSILQHELEPFIHKNVDSGDELEGSHSANRITTTKDLLHAVRELIRSESHVRQKLIELEKKECAFRETINEADRIMSNHVTHYTRRIEELEAALEQKDSRIQQLENSEERLRSTMKNSWKSGEGPRITDLLDRLIETENSELQLKERVWNLERNGKELQIKIVEAEKAQEQLRGELKDQEELVQRLMTLTSENNALTSQLHEAHEAVKRSADIQQSENYLKSRVDELESSEGTLRDNLKQAEQLIVHRERKTRDQVMNYEEELSTLRGELDHRMNELSQSKETEVSLKQQAEEFKSQILSLEKELKESSSESICHESQHRSEVTKLRTQLKVVNSQLTDLDALNGELKERIEATELAMKEVATQLEERCRRHENEVLSLNLNLSQKDSKIEEYEVQIQQMAHAHVVSELDYLATSPLVQIQTSLEKFIKDSKVCKECSLKNDYYIDSLSESLKSLIEVINGRSSQSDSDSEDYEASSAENLASEFNQTTTASPPNPAQEGLKEITCSGDEEVISVISLPITNSYEPTKRSVVKSKSSELPSIPPRVKRDAKKKRKVRKAVQKGSLLQELENETSLEGGSFYGRCPPSITILEELEEKVRELEGVVTQKEKELRLADMEAAEFHVRLIEEDEKFHQKDNEVQQSNAALASLREQLLVTVQEYERVRQVLEAKHKADTGALATKVNQLTEDLLKAAEKSTIKDKIIDTLVQQIRAILRSGNMAVIINQLRQISSRESTAKRNNKAANNTIDFDVESVCQLINEPFQVDTLQPSSPLDDVQPDLLDYKSLPYLASRGKIDLSLKGSEAMDPDGSSKALLGVPSAGKACPTPRNLPPLLENKKSRIPRLRPLSVPPLKHADCPLEQRDLEDFGTRSLSRLYKRSNTAVAKLAVVEIRQELKPLAKVVPKQRPTAKVTPKPKVLSSPSLHSIDKKVPFSEDLQNKFISDARKIRRMVTGLTPIDAEIDCSLAPEFAKQPSPPVPTCVPRPTNLKITRRVGLDGAVIAWSPLEHDCVAGFQVILGGKVVQTVRSPHRTKALVTGLPFPSNFTIALVAISEDGRCSTPTLVTHEKSQIYKPKIQRSSSLGDTRLLFASRRSIPTCL